MQHTLMRHTLTLFGAVLLLANCTKGSSQPPGREAPPAPSAKVPERAPEAAPVAKAAAEEEKKVELTEALVAKYVTYLKDVVASRKALVAQYRAETAKLEKEKGLKQGVDAMKLVQELPQAFEAAERKALESSGLSAEEVKVLSDAVGAVVMPRMLVTKDALEAQAAMVKQAQANLEKLPPEQRTKAEQQLKEVTEGLNAARDVPEARQKYGDKAVDAVLKHEVELAGLQKEALAAGAP